MKYDYFSKLTGIKHSEKKKKPRESYSNIKKKQLNES